MTEEVIKEEKVLKDTYKNVQALSFDYLNTTPNDWEMGGITAYIEWHLVLKCQKDLKTYMRGQN